MWHQISRWSSRASLYRWLWQTSFYQRFGHPWSYTRDSLVLRHRPISRRLQQGRYDPLLCTWAISQHEFDRVLRCTWIVRHRLYLHRGVWSATIWLSHRSGSQPCFLDVVWKPSVWGRKPPCSFAHLTGLFKPFFVGQWMDEATTPVSWEDWTFSIMIVP